MERLTMDKIMGLEASSLESSSMDIDSPSSSPVAIVTSSHPHHQRRQPHTCSSLSVSPNSNSSRSSSTSSSTIEFLNEVATKKCTCPYERPTLKTMEAASLVSSPTISLSPITSSSSSGGGGVNTHQPPQSGPPSSSLSESRLILDDAKNANVLHQAHVQNDNNNMNDNSRGCIVDSVNNLMVCDSEASRGIDSNLSIMMNSVNNNNGSSSNNITNQNQMSNSRRSSTPTSEGKEVSQDMSNNNSNKKLAVIVDPKKKKSSSKKSSNNKCNCDEMAKVKAESPKSSLSMKRISSPGKSSSGDGILSNCLSALNFVSGNRIGIGSSDSKSGSSGSSSGWSPRGNKGGKAATTTNDSTNQLCGEHCSKKGSMVSAAAIAAEAPTSATGKSAKMCESCGGHGLSTGDIAAAGASKDKAADGHVVASTTTAISSSKPKRSNWALRFSCGRLKGSKASSSTATSSHPPSSSSSSASTSSSSTSSPMAKESPCSKCSTESTTKTSGVVNSATKKKKSSSSDKNKKKTTTTTKSNDGKAEPRIEVISGSAVASSCSRVTTAAVGTSGQQSGNSSSTTTVNELSFGAIMTSASGSSTDTMMIGVPTSSSPAKDCSRLSLIENATEDCDEWARMQREREIEDGVEAPPGYLPKFQFNKIQEAAAATAQPSSTTSAAGGAALQNNLLARQQQPQLQSPLMNNNNNSSNGQNLARWPIGMVNPATADGRPNAPLLFPHMMYEPKIHSQVDFIHCLVPDLQKITSCGFYWGKMDRYQAESLLDQKPEGTFLLRDSAQEEFLFSVSFRKYGRSLHARIEQFNHKFSFDSHDPGVYTANTVTGLLEHYKDPSTVMFFEPMLTQPLNRNFCFSLQQLCRATIVSETTYDKIGDLKLPQVMKGYLKEYHYKQKVRVNMYDELRITSVFNK